MTPETSPAASAAPAKISVRDLHFYYGKFHALKGINLDIPEKQVTAFIGPSGCGKSTLLRIFNRMYELYPDQRAEGQILLDGQDLLDRKKDVALLRAKVGMVFQKPTPFPMSIYDNIAFGVRLFENLSKADMNDRVEWALRKAALWDEVKDKINQSGSGLSGGQQQRLCIARGIAVKPEVLLLDAELPDAQPLCFLPRRKDHEYSLDHFQHSFYLRSNREGKNFGLYKTKVRDERKWEVLIPARDQVMLEGFTLFTDWLVVEERQRGLTSIRQINRKTREVVGIAFDDPAYVTWIGFNPEPESSRLRYGYSSMTTPDTLFELDMDTGQRQVIKQAEVR